MVEGLLNLFWGFEQPHFFCFRYDDDNYALCSASINVIYEMILDGMEDEFVDLGRFTVPSWVDDLSTLVCYCKFMSEVE